MILRDCYAGTDGMFDIPRYGLRFFDVLLMKMCEDYDRMVALILPQSRPHADTADRPLDHGCRQGFWPIRSAWLLLRAVICYESQRAQ